MTQSSKDKIICKKCGKCSKPIKVAGVPFYQFCKECFIKLEYPENGSGEEDWENFVNKIWSRGNVPEWANDVKIGIIQEGKTLLKQECERIVELLEEEYPEDAMLRFTPKGKIIKLGQFIDMDELKKILFKKDEEKNDE